MTTHIKNGEVDFPQWVKALAWVVGLCFPIAIAGGIWMASAVFDISLRMARMEAALASATDDRYRQTQANDAHDALRTRIQGNTDDIRELQRLHGRN